jgi:membrane-bound metal-dependent hydrolase YbcI (DUF457 family)
MFLGHYGLALASKRAAPETSLGSSVVAAQWLDLLWPILLLVGIERARVAPGFMEASSVEFVHYPITHSLLMVLAWGVLVGGVYWLLTRRKVGAAVLGALVVSHWVLDAVVHQPDLPLWPGSDVHVGVGVWGSLALTLIFELGLLTVGLVLYTRATRAIDAVGQWGLRVMIFVLVGFYLSGFAAPPPSVDALAYGGLALWLFVPWAAWVDRHRERKLPPMQEIAP